MTTGSAPAAAGATNNVEAHAEPAVAIGRKIHPSPTLGAEIVDHVAKSGTK